MDAAGTPDPPPNESYASAIDVDADTPRGGSADPKSLEGIMNRMHESMCIKSYHKSNETDMDVDAAPVATSNARVDHSPRRPATKRNQSSPRRAVAALLSVGAAISTSENTSANVPPSIDRRSDASALAGLFDEPRPDEPRPPPKKQKKKRASGVAMIGLVPKTGFVMPWRRGIVPTNMSQVEINKRIEYTRKSTLNHFDLSWDNTRQQNSPEEEATGPTTRSNADEDDWLVDVDAAECKVTDMRRLDRCPLEHIVTLPEKSSMLLLVKVEDDDNKFGGKAAAVHGVQGLKTRSISNHNYYQLKCTISDTSYSRLVTTGVASKMHTNTQFVQDYNIRNGGFQVQFNDTNEKVQRHREPYHLRVLRRSVIKFQVI